MTYIKVVCGKTKTRISAEIPWQSSKKCMSQKVTLALDCKDKQMKRRNPLPKPLPSPRKEANQANLGRVDFPLYPPSRLLFSTPPFKKERKISCASGLMCAWVSAPQPEKEKKRPGERDLEKQEYQGIWSLENNGQPMGHVVLDGEGDHEKENR